MQRFGSIVVFGLEIGILKSVSHSNERIRITSRYQMGSDPSHANADNRKSTMDRKQVRVLSTAHEFIYKSGDILIGAIYTVQSPS